MAAVVLRWRRSRGQERQQLKWLVYMVTLTLAAGFGGLVSGYVSGAYSYISALAIVAVSAGVGLCIPVAKVVAVLRYRLYDIDVVINRTLVYSALTAMLALVYFGGVATTQAIFRALTGQQEQPQIAVVSTLVIAALLTP